MVAAGVCPQLQSVGAMSGSMGGRRERFVVFSRVPKAPRMLREDALRSRQMTGGIPLHAWRFLPTGGRPSESKKKARAGQEGKRVRERPRMVVDPLAVEHVSRPLVSRPAGLYQPVDRSRIRFW